MRFIDERHGASLVDFQGQLRKETDSETYRFQMSINLPSGVIYNPTYYLSSKQTFRYMLFFNIAETSTLQTEDLQL